MRLVGRAVSRGSSAGKACATVLHCKAAAAVPAALLLEAASHLNCSCLPAFLLRVCCLVLSPFVCVVGVT